VPLNPATAEPSQGLLPGYRTLHGGSCRMGELHGEGAIRKGPWQSVLHSPFFRGRMFWEERVCWQPDPPSGCGDLQRRRCWQLTSPLLLLGFLPVHTADPSPDRRPDQVLLSSAAQAQPYLSPFVPCTMSGGLTTLFTRGGRAVSLCNGINQLQNNNNLRSCTASYASRNLMVEKGNGKHGNMGRAQEEAYEKEIAVNPPLSPTASPETIVASSLPRSISHAAGPCAGISKSVGKVGKALYPLLLLEAWMPRVNSFAQRHLQAIPLCWW